MTKSSAQIPFIDIAVQDAVREAMLDGKAAIIFDRDIENVIWANGAAAQLFHHQAIGSFLTAGLEPFSATLRQLRAAAARSPKRPQAMLLRVSAGVTSGLAQAHMQIIALRKHDVEVVLLIIERSTPEDDDAKLAKDSIAGLEADGAGAAITGPNGVLIANGPLFSDLKIPSAALEKLSADIIGEDDRLIKRLVDRGDGKSPVAIGIGRLSENPVRNLIVAMETDDDANSETDGSQSDDTEDAESDLELLMVSDLGVELPMDPPLPETDDLAQEPKTQSRTVFVKTIDSPSVTLNNNQYDDDEIEAALKIIDKDTGRRKKYSRGPVRFVWKTDEHGHFTDVSKEFAGAVGTRASDVVGKSLHDILRAYEMDPSGNIKASMDKHETWSGKTVLWPVEGTDLRVPVDLAALPYYNRAREFEGYHGFGVVRMGDAVVDPQSAGMAFASSSDDENDLHTYDDHSALTNDADDLEAPNDAQAEDELKPQTSDFYDHEDGDDDAEELATDRAELDDHNNSKPDNDIPLKPAGTLFDDEDLYEEPTYDKDPFQGEMPAIHSSKMVPLRRKQDLINPEDLDDEVDFKNQADIGNQANLDNQADLESQSDSKNQTELEIEQVTEPISNVRKARNGLDDSAADAFKRIGEVLGAQDDDDEDDISGEAATVNAGLGPDELDALPLPLLIVRGETALYGNKSFCAMSGYNTVDELNEGGLATLFGHEGAELDGDTSQDDRSLSIIDADGASISVRAHLQLVPWLGSKALMFAFEPQPAETTEEDDEDYEQISDNTSAGSSDDAMAAFDEIAEMRAILDTATDGVVVIGQDGAIRSINSSASALFGFSDNDVRGKSFSILFANESQRAAMDYLSGFSNNGVESLLNEGREVLAREQNGGFIPVFMTIGRLPTSNGYCAVLRDVTAWKHTEQALQEAKTLAEEASSTKSDFLAKVSHEIRTPLNAIIGFSELMTEERFGPIDNAKYKDYLVDINKSGRHVLDLVNDLLDISKIEAGEQDLTFESVLLNEATEDAISMVQPQANRNGIIVRSSMDSTLPPVVADQRSVKQIVLNLLSNAIRFTQSGGQVVVTTKYTSSGAVILRIRDSGIGMSPREIETAMRPFQQIATRERGQNDGTGLGLPLTKALVEANRAEFEISSEPGKGTSIEITFPPARVLAD